MMLASKKYKSNRSVEEKIDTIPNVEEDSKKDLEQQENNLEQTENTIIVEENIENSDLRLSDEIENSDVLVNEEINGEDTENLPDEKVEEEANDSNISLEDDVSIEEEKEKEESSLEDKSDDISEEEVVSMEDEEKEKEEISLENSDDTDENDISPKIVDVDEKNNNDIELAEFNKKHGMHIGFGIRISILIFFSLLFLGGACFFGLQALDHGEDRKESYVENSDISYSVCTAGNDLVNENCLGENLKYNTSLSDKIKATFYYTRDYSSVLDYSLNYHIVAVTRVFETDNPEELVYQNEEVLVEKTDVSNTNDSVDFYENVDIDYKSFYTSVAVYQGRYTSDLIATLDVILYLDDESGTRKISSISMPLTGTEIEVNKSVIQGNKGNVVLENSEWTDYNIMCVVIAAVLLLIFLILFIKTTRFVLRATLNRNKYQRRLIQILRDYDRVIVVARDGYESNVLKEIVKVKSFEELLQIRDELQSVIIFSKINNIKSEFIVEDDDKLYKYVLKESDL